MGAGRVTHLLGLPDEVLVAIFSFLDFADHRQAVLVSKQFQGLSEPYLYQNLQVQRSDQALALVYSLRADIQRLSFVRRLLVSTKLGEEAGVSALPPFLAQMHNLQSLILETPDCNSLMPEERVDWVKLQDEYEDIFDKSSALVKEPEDRLLPKLRSCIIHFVDSNREIYSMTRYSMLLLHPGLRSLTISCASTDFPGALLKRLQNHQEFQKSTRLEFLHLEECDLFPQTLALLLSLPCQLKALKVSEGTRYPDFQSRSSRLHGSVSPSAFVQAISQHCQQSLEWLSLSLGHNIHSSRSINHVDQHLALSGFMNIKYLEVDVRTVRLLRSQPCDHQTWRRLPPNLEGLKVFGIPIIQRLSPRPMSYPKLPLEECLIREKTAHGVPKLKDLIFDFEHTRDEEQLRQRVLDIMGAHQDFYYVALAISVLKDECIRYAPICKKAGVHLQLRSTTLPRGYIPPYLFYEEHPTSETIWQTEQ